VGFQAKGKPLKRGENNIENDFRRINETSKNVGNFTARLQRLLHCEVKQLMSRIQEFVIVVSRGLSGHRARRRVADSRGPVLMAGLSLNK
jgi:hypothetical protein